jgi:hypothetical protein
MRIGHASINEKGKASGGKAGDQTGKEICIRNYYVYKGGWSYVLRCVNPYVANNMATVMEAICNNPFIGYDQPYRNTAYILWLKYGSIGAINTPCSTDCSASVTLATIAGFKASNVDLSFNYGSNAPTTKTMKKVFRDTGKFILLTDKKYLTKGDYLKRGDILVKEGHHTVMVLDDGINANAGTVVLKNPYKEPLLVVKKGMHGASVKWVQWYLKNLGYKDKAGKIIVIDGAFGNDTEYALKAFQKDKGLTVDGKCGLATKKKLKEE